MLPRSVSTAPETSQRRPRARASVLWAIGALGILALAFALRLHGLRWDAGYLLHPDERFQLMVAVDRIQSPRSPVELLSLRDSPWNPRRAGLDGQPQAFAYGALPLYVLELTSWIVDRARPIAWWLPPAPEGSYATLAFRGRALSAAIDVVGIAFAMALAWRAFGRPAALVAGFLVSTSVIAIQQAHFFVVDPWAAALGMVTLWCAYRLARAGTPRWAVCTGVAYAAALACKVSMWPLAVPIAVALGWRTWGDVGDRSERSAVWRLLTGVPWPATMLATIVAYALLEPYSVLDPVPMLRDVLREWQIARGDLDVPYTRQYVGTVPIVYQFVQLLRWGLGPAFTIVASLAVLAAAWSFGRALLTVRATGSASRAFLADDRLLVRTLLVSWVVSYALTAWTSETKYLRYSLPLVAPLAVLASDWITTRWRAARRLVWRGALLGLAGLVLAGTGTWAVAFATIYDQPHTRVSASQWMAAHIPAGATLGVEHWDDRLPLPLPGLLPEQRYRFVSLDWYDDRTPEQSLEYLSQRLAEIDYIVLSSDRLAGSIPRLPWRYPVTSEYYRLLDSGALGFRLVYEGRVESAIGPLRLDDYAADESFTVYDHPRVRIYQKVRSLSDTELRALFAWALAQPYVPQRERPTAYRQLLGMPVEASTPAQDIGWADRWFRSDALAIAWWCLLLVLVTAVGLPLSLRFFRSLPDLGLGLARPLGLVLVAYPVWLGASWRVAPFELPTIVLCFGLLAALSWRLGWPALRVVPVRRRWWALATTEGSFWLAFGFFLLLRWRYPDLWHPYFGGEKPMELAYINAVARSRWMPPYDPWFSDGVQNYYYYGFFLVALLWKASGLFPERAFQLTLATFAGLVAAAVATLGMELARRVTCRGADAWPATHRGWIVAGGLGAVWWVLFAGNLDPLGQLLTRHSLRIDFWQSSRVVANAITEFPYFSFLYADLHPHVLALPLWLTAVAVALARHSERNGSSLPEDGGSWLLLVLCASTAAVVNSWDLPLAAALIVAGTIAIIRPRSPKGWGAVVLLGALGLAASRLSYWPFYERFVSPVTSIRLARFSSAPSELFFHFGLLLALPIVAALILGLRSSPGSVRCGAIAAATATAGFAIGTLGRIATESPPKAEQVVWLLALLTVLFALVAYGLPLFGFDPALPETRSAMVVLGLASGALAAWRMGAAIFLIACSFAAIWLAVHWRRRAAPVVALWALGAGAVLAAELFVVVDDLYGSPWERMNTVFKFFNEAWPLLAVSGWALVLWAWTQPGRARTTVATGLVGLLFALSALYLVLGTPSRLALRLPSTPNPGSLDGYAWMIGGRYTNSLGQPIDTTEDYTVIQWLRSHVTDNAVVLEASIGPYRGNGARISSATGLPTVLGWDRHERQQRTIVAPIDGTVRTVSPLGDAIDQRLRDVRELYDSTDPARKEELLRRYRVRYVVVGPVERLWRVQPGFAGASVPDEPYASPEGLATFAALEGHALRRVATFGDTVIYEVLPPVEG
ncbi:MAG: DUF2298 domain-containing protein [Thermomicrobium sp.]|nr:DUF2298 domain-containing protein [Thermomicrobium sp.]